MVGKDNSAPTVCHAGPQALQAEWEDLLAQDVEAS